MILSGLGAKNNTNWSWNSQPEILLEIDPQVPGRNICKSSLEKKHIQTQASDNPTISFREYDFSKQNIKTQMYKIHKERSKTVRVNRNKL